MNKIEFIAYCIQHTEDYPDTGELTLEGAATFLNNLAPNKVIPEITSDEFLQLWNQLVHEPSVMDID